MAVSLDGQDLFDERGRRIEFGSWERVRIERSASGLDGIVSIDLGRRGRRIRQKGSLRATSSARMRERLDAIEAFLDDNVHRLAMDDGQVFENVRMDSFRVIEQRASGDGICCEYEIVYTQLKV